MTLPFFSIILPTYNRAHLIGKAIESVQAQTFSDWELLLVDDGSTDNTKSIAQSYAAEDPRIKYIYQKNAERCAARNNGIRNSSGKYICFLDSDDYYLQDRLQQLAGYLAEKKQAENFFFTGLVVKKSADEFMRVDFSRGNQSVFDFIVTHPIHCQQVCIRSTVLKQIPFDERFFIGEDTELWLRVSATCPPVYIENQFTVVVVDHEDRSVNLKRYNSPLEFLGLLEYIFTPPHPGSKTSKDIQKQTLANCYFNMGKHYIYNRQRVRAIKCMLYAIAKNTSSHQLKYRVNLLLRLTFCIPFADIEKLL